MVHFKAFFFYTKCRFSWVSLANPSCFYVFFSLLMNLLFARQTTSFGFWFHGFPFFRSFTFDRPIIPFSKSDDQFWRFSMKQNWNFVLSWQAFAAKHGCFFWSVWKMFCLKISKEMLFFIILAISIMMILNCSKCYRTFLEFIVVILSKDVNWFFLCRCYCTQAKCLAARMLVANLVALMLLSIK